MKFEIVRKPGKVKSVTWEITKRLQRDKFGRLEFCSRSLGQWVLASLSVEDLPNAAIALSLMNGERTDAPGGFSVEGEQDGNIERLYAPNGEPMLAVLDDGSVHIHEVFLKGRSLLEYADAFAEVAAQVRAQQ